jgi:polar amino acid transport system substrate-binding protein
MNSLTILGLTLALLCAGPASAQESTMKELAPTGKLRVGLVFAPSKSLFFNIKEGDKAVGITADIAAAFAEKLGVPVEQTIFPNSGLATDALEGGKVDVSFMPVDDARKKRIAFGPAYVIAESTYMVTAASGAKTADDVDKPGMRVIGIAGTATIRMVTAKLKNTTISPVTSVDDAVAAMRDGKADAFALGRDSLPPYLAQVPGSRMTEGAFHYLPIAIAVAKDKPAALAAITGFMTDAKASGLVRRILDKHGFADPVAPATQ